MKIFLFFIFLSYTLSAKEIWMTEKGFFPSEFDYLLESLQRGEMLKGEKRSFESILKELEPELTPLNKEELLFLLKGEIYKNLLTYYKSIPDTLLEEGQEELLKKALEEKGSRLEPFALWLMIAIKKDVELLLKSPVYSQLKLNSKTKETLRLRRKMTVLAPWVQNFLSMSVDEFHNELRPLMWKLFRRLENNIRLFKTSTRFEKVAAKTLFRKSEISSIDHFKDLDDYLRIEILKQKLPAPIADEAWFPKDATYTAPKVLPKPVDDWDLDQKWNTNALPKPVDDWVLD